MQAIRTKRPSLIKLLVMHGADVTSTDNRGRSPLLIAGFLDDVKAATSLLETGAPSDDGSLHYAARNLNHKVVEILLQNKHNPNHPSDQAGGRTPLADLLFAGQASARNSQAVKKTINVLRAHGADVRSPSLRKPLICWALDNPSPVFMVQALLSAYLHEQIDEDFNLYFEQGYYYSPTMYVAKKKFAGPQEATAQLLQLLKCANRDVFYHILDGPQPPDAVGMPQHIAAAETARKAREAKVQAENDERARQITLRREEEAEAQMLVKQRHDLGIALAAEQEEAEQDRLRKREVSEQQRMQTRHALRLSMQTEVAQQERQSLLENTRIQKQNRDDELRDRTSLANVDMASMRERYKLEREHQSQIESAARRALEGQASAQKKMLESQDHYHARQHERKMKQLTMEKAVPVGVPFPALPGNTVKGYIEG